MSLQNSLKKENSLTGLRSVKRDWSDAPPSQALPSSQSSVHIEWPASPPRPKRIFAPTSSLTSDDASTPPTSNAPPLRNSYDTRVKTVQAMLDAAKRTALSALENASTVPSKRPSEVQGNEPLAKKRTLPASWTNPARAPPVQKGPKVVVSSHASTPSSNSFASSSITPRVYVPPEEQDAPSVATIFLSNEQQHILKLVQTGHNVFFTGSAGTGKSVLLREIISCLRKKYSKSEDAVAITASTGIAACNIGGVTLHSFSGIGLGLESPSELATKVKRNKKASTRWLRTKVLLIDEISMVDGDLFDKLAAIACILRKNKLPFGGIQLIVSGDFFQLPPVSKTGNVKFAFEAEQWSECIKRTFNLTKVFRQKDPEFINMLNEMRFGRLSPESVTKFKALARPILYNDGIEPTELYPRREDVDRANSARTSALTGTSRTYFAKDFGDEKLLGNLMAPQQLQLRVDSQVMMIKNTDENLVNGSMGRVIDFVDPNNFPQPGEKEDDAKPKSKSSKADGSATKYPLVRFNGGTSGECTLVVTPETWKIEAQNGEVLASRMQLPLILSWAMSIHKSQGQTLDRVKVNLNKVFEKGQAYVALSRATSLQGLEVYGFDPAKVQAHPKVATWSRTLESI